MSLGGMVVRNLRMLGSVRVFALFMGICGLSMRFGSFFVVFGGFVVVVFRHLVSSDRQAFQWPWLIRHTPLRF